MVQALPSSVLSAILFPMNTPITVNTPLIQSPESISAAACSVESGIENTLRRAEQRLHEAGDRCRAAVRRTPGRSILIAAAGGYLANRLPLASLLTVGVKLAGAFTAPTLMALGICRVAGYCRGKDREFAVQGSTAADDDANRVLATDA